MVLLELAVRVLNSPGEFLFEDQLEALQFINDIGRTDALNPIQRAMLGNYIECGLVFTAPFKS